MDIKNKHLLPRMLVAAIGLIFCGIGVGLSLYADLGVDPASVMETGVARVTGLSFGTATALINLAILLVVLFIDRSYINISSLLAIFFIGYVADAVTWVLNLVFLQSPSLAGRIALLLIGNVIIALGVAVYIVPKLGVGAIDLVSQIISDKGHLTYRWVRIAGDLSYLLIGWALGGAVGVGTVVSAFMVGPVVQFWRPIVYKVTDRIPGCAH